MDAEITYNSLKEIALLEFADITHSATIIRGPLNLAKSLRLFLSDDSFLEVWLSNKKYSYHWQRKDGKIYRHDNAPHYKNKNIKTFPKHFHLGFEENIEESNISDNPKIAIRQFLEFIRENIKQN